jgi:hypothetical protein
VPTPGASTPVIASADAGSRSPWMVIRATAAFSSWSSSRLNLTLSAPMFSRRCDSLVVLGIGTMHGFWASSQAR